MKIRNSIPPLTFSQGQLFVVATPIGNLGDISARALEILQTVDFIACEDTRHTKNLCRHFGIATPLVSYYRENEQSKSEHLIQQLQQGKNIALVSDAGTPAISDPGAVLVRKARQAGVKIIAIAGPSALAAALSIAGLEQSSFFFSGFLPPKKNDRQRWLRQLVALPSPLIFYEAPHRIAATLQDMLLCLGDRQALLFRELTKLHEECLQDTLSGLLARIQSGVKGELVLVVQGADASSTKPDLLDLHQLLCWHRDRQSTLKDAVSSIARDLGLPRSEVYKQALEMWEATP